MQLDLLRDYLQVGGLDNDSLSQLVASHGWQTVTREDGTKMMEIRKQEATIKPKKNLAKIDFDSELSPIRLLYLRGSVLYLFLPTTYICRCIRNLVRCCSSIELNHSLLVSVYIIIQHYYESIIICQIEHLGTMSK